MIDRYSRLKMRRKLRSRKKKVVSLGQTANKEIDRHIFRRWHNIKYAKRFTIGWVLLITLLCVGVVFQTKALGSYYLIAKQADGGIYTEGIEGTFSNANPIFASSTADSSVSKLIFSSLLKYDANNKLVGDLANSYEVDSKGTTYTIKLKPNTYWHDGTRFTADDVVFTYATIKNPDTKSPLQTSWSNVKVEKIDDKTVKFIIPNTYSPFPHSLTNGIIPKHLLKDLSPSQLRSADFNTKNPIGTGPFKWQQVSVNGTKEDQIQIIELVKNDGYFGGNPKLDGVTISTYTTKKQLLESLNNKDVLAASGLDIQDADIDKNYEITNLYQNSATMLFLNNTNIESAIRKPLVQATNTTELMKSVGYPTLPVKSPFLINQFPYNPAITQLPFNSAEANKQLEDQGWIMNKDKGYRYKGEKELKFRLVSENKPEYERIAKELQKQWINNGINLEVSLQSAEEITKNYLVSHDYDILLYGINIGADPDVYAYWHSSQADKKSTSRLNLSDYKSTIADISLEAGRTRSDEQLRTAKYKPFLEVWRKDAPAVGLYQPRYLYITNQHIFGLEEKTINVPSDRFNNINEWQINTVRSSK